MRASAHILGRNSTTRVMLWVLIALLPAVAVQVWQFGPAILVNLAWASLAALGIETLALQLRNRPIRPALMDGSALVTAWLLALSLPAYAPWWLTLIGMLFAIGVAKHLYGGLGQNMFNPAMIGYAVLIVSFPALMGRWPAPTEFATPLDFLESARYIFTGVLPAASSLDALTHATPLDTLRTGLLQKQPLDSLLAQPIFGYWGGVGGEWLALAFLAGGLWLVALRIAAWQSPLGFLAGVAGCAALLMAIDPTRYADPLLHLLIPSVMLGAFFIVTDPVSGASTGRGRFLFGLGAGLLTVLIRALGGYPDGVAFAVLLMNLCAPLIDTWTRPRVYGTGKPADRQ
jgi:electron transport complex protein RnfD